MIKGIVFDLDGVLINTEKTQWQGWNKVLEPFGISLTKEDYFAYAGKRGDIIEAELFERYGLDLRAGDLLEKKDSMLVEWFESKPPELMLYAIEAIDFFNQKKMAIALASSGPRPEVMVKLRGAGLAERFKIVVTGSDVGRGKPYPDIYQKATQMIGIEAGCCISFEDTQYGVESAKEAGLVCFAIPNEFTLEQDFSKADGRFKDLKEAINWLEKKLP